MKQRFRVVATFYYFEECAMYLESMTGLPFEEILEKLHSLFILNADMYIIGKYHVNFNINTQHFYVRCEIY